MLPGTGNGTKAGRWAAAGRMTATSRTKPGKVLDLRLAAVGKVIAADGRFLERGHLYGKTSRAFRRPCARCLQFATAAVSQALAYRLLKTRRGHERPPLVVLSLTWRTGAGCLDLVMAKFFASRARLGR